MQWLRGALVIGGWNLFLLAAWQLAFIPLWEHSHLCFSIDLPDPRACDAAIYASDHPPSYWLALLAGNALLAFGYGVFRLVERSKAGRPALP